MRLALLYLLSAALVCWQIVPATALAQTKAPTTVQFTTELMDSPNGDAWHTETVSLSWASPAGLTMIPQLERHHRFDTVDETWRLSVGQSDRTKGYWLLQGGFSQSPMFRPETMMSFEGGRPYQFDTSMLKAAVIGLRAEHSNYLQTSVFSIGPQFELYPRSQKYWLSGKVLQSWKDDRALPLGGQIRADLPLAGNLRAFSLLAAGSEYEGAAFIRSKGGALGLVYNLGKQTQLTVTSGFEKRGQAPARQTFSLSIRQDL